MPEPKIRCLVEFLRNHDLVQSVKLSYRFLYVTFVTGIRERWHLVDTQANRRYDFVVDNETLTSSRRPQKKPRFESMTIKPQSHQFVIRYKDFIRCGLLQQRLEVHSLIHEITTAGTIETSVPMPVLIEEVEKVNARAKRINYDCKNRRYKVLVAGACGRLILMHFMPWLDIGKKPLREALRPYELFTAIHKNLKIKKNITTESVLRKLGTLGYGPKFVEPCFYRQLVRDLGLSGMVIADPEPGAGSKLLACCMEGCQYRSPIQKGMSEMAQFLGSEIGDLADGHYDVAILDGDFRRTPDSETIKTWMQKADTLIVFSLSRDAERVRKLMKPDRAYEIVMAAKGINSLFVKN